MALHHKQLQLYHFHHLTDLSNKPEDNSWAEMLEVMDPLQQPLFYYELHAHSTGADNNYIDEAKSVKS